MNEELKIIEEVVKTTGKVIDAGRQFGSFISRYTGGTLEQGFGIFEDKLKYMRWERQVRLMLRAQEFMTNMGIESPTKQIPLKYAIPFFQAASLEDDNYLQDLWAKLLVNSSNADCGIDLNRTFIDILERLSVLEAKILEVIYKTSFYGMLFDEMLHKRICTAHLPDEMYFNENSNDYEKLKNEEVLVALINLSRIGCLAPTISLGGGEIYDLVNPTHLGKRFVEACTCMG